MESEKYTFVYGRPSLFSIIIIVSNSSVYIPLVLLDSAIPMISDAYLITLWIISICLSVFSSFLLSNAWIFFRYFCVREFP